MIPPAILAILTGAALFTGAYIYNHWLGSSKGAAPFIPTSNGYPPVPTPVPTPPQAQAQTGHVVVFGDSLASGRNSYPELLAGLIGTRGFEVHKIAQVGASSRWVRNQARTHLASMQHAAVIVLAGVNDGNSRVASTIANLRSVYEAARAQGARVIAITELPWRGYGSWTPEAQGRQDQANRWILSGGDGLIDVAIDAYSVMSDPQRPGYLASQYDSRDGLHLNAAGQRRLADVIAARAFS